VYHPTGEQVMVYVIYRVYRLMMSPSWTPNHPIWPNPIHTRCSIITMMRLWYGSQ